MSTRFGLVALAGILAFAGGGALLAQGARPLDGKALFQARCAGCHGKGVWATRVLSRRVEPGQAMLAKRTDLNPDLVKTVVRFGIGEMPAIRKAELDDASLAAIAAYLDKEDQP